MNPRPPGPAEFPATHWTLISSAKGPDRDAALGRLYRLYWEPLCRQARRFGVPADDVEDFVQELCLSVFVVGAIERADPSRGRFRSFLLGALRNQLSHRRAHQHALKRGGGTTRVPLGTLEPPQGPADDREFDADWARALFGEAMRRIDQEEQHSDPSRISWEQLGPCVVGNSEVCTKTAAWRLGITVAAVKTRIFRLRQRFREIVREEVRRTVASDADCDEEYRYLVAVIETSGGITGPPARL